MVYLKDRFIIWIPKYMQRGADIGSTSVAAKESEEDPEEEDSEEDLEKAKD